MIPNGFLCFWIIWADMCRFSRNLMFCVWIAPLTPTVVVMRGVTFQPWVLIAVTRGVIFVLLCSDGLVCVSIMCEYQLYYLDCQVGNGMNGHVCSCMAPCIYMMSA